MKPTSLRIFSAGLCLSIAACGGPPEGVAPADPSNLSAIGSGTPAGDPVERVACADGGEPLVATCTIDRGIDAQGALLVIRHADGGFRRLRVDAGGAIRAADGAVPVRVTTRDGVADVSIGTARYRIPVARP